jgi:hypothetical protein
MKNGLTDVKWRLVYDKLWLRFKSEEFRFEDALEAIFEKKKFSAEEVKYASKLLNEIEDNAYAVHTRTSYDQRIRLYRVLNPEKVSNARAVFVKLFDKASQRGMGIHFGKLAEEANKSLKWNYMYVKDSAVGFLTGNYRSIDINHISVFEKDLDGWIALFRLWNCQIIVNNKVVYESKAKAQAVRIHVDLDGREGVNEMTNTHYQLPEYAIAECLEDGEILDALAVMITNRNMGMGNWDKAIKSAKVHGVINTLGFCMDVINKEANKKVFSSELVEKVEKSVNERIETIGQKPEIGTSVNLDYQNLENKWNVKCYQASVFRKAVLDLL